MSTRVEHDTVQIYANFGTVIERAFRKKFKAQKHIDTMLRFEFFPVFTEKG